MFAVFESCLGNRKMVVPVGSYINQIYIGPLADVFISVFSEVNIGRRKTGLTQIFLWSYGAGRIIITESHNLNARNMGKTVDSSGAAHAEADKCNPHCLELWSGEA